MPAFLNENARLVLLSSWYLIRGLWYLIIMGVAVAAALGTLLRRKGLPAFLRRSGPWAVLAAAAAGVASPVCTVGTVPIFVELRRTGAPTGPSVAFLTASSALNPQMLVLVIGALGATVGVAQVLAAIGVSVATAVLLSRLSSSGPAEVETGRLREQKCTLRHRGGQQGGAHNAGGCPGVATGHQGGQGGQGGQGAGHPGPEHGRHAADGCHGPALGGEQTGPGGVLLEMLDRFLDLLGFVGCYFLGGVILASIIGVYVPRGTVIAALGAGKWYAVPAGAVLSVPLYACGGAAVPILQTASGMGAGAGAILAYLVVGPLTRVGAIANMTAVFGKRAAAAYVLLVTVLGIVFGYGFAAIRAAM